MVELPFPRPRLVPRRGAIALALLAMGGPLAAAPARRAPVITLLYTTAETSTSAAVVWNTSIASDSLVRYGTSAPLPADAPRVYSAAQVTVHDVQLEGLAPGTLYHYEVTSCAPKRGCVSATGRFDTYPACPDEVPPVSGAWEREPSPNVAGTTELTNQLLGVAALSESDAWAVGWSQEPGGPPFVKRNLTQHHDGSGWRIVPSPNPAGDTQSVLYAVSAASTHDVWAVGSTHDGTLPSRTLIQHWDGAAWSLVPSPSPDTQLNELLAVAAVAADDAWAVGFRGGTRSETPLESLILRWDGTSWAQVASPNVPAGANQLSGIAAIAPDDVWAVGSAGGAPLALHWDGSAWSVVPVEGHGGLSGERLVAVAGASGDDVWAVGQGRGFFSNRAAATLRHWDGAHWTLKVCRASSASNPPPDYEGGGPDSYFTGVSAVASDDVWAVGVAGSGPMILHWDGEAWTTVTHPRAFPDSEILRGVATTSEGGAWAVGGEYVAGPSGSFSLERTLIHRYSP